MNEKLLLQDLVSLLAKKAKITQKEADKFYREFFQLILECIYSNDIAKVKDLGTFKLIQVSSRESVDVNTGEKIEIPPHLKLSFIPDKGLKALVNKPFAQFESVILEEGIVFDSSKGDTADNIIQSDISAEIDDNIVIEESNNDLPEKEESISDVDASEIVKDIESADDLIETESEPKLTNDESVLLTEDDSLLELDSIIEKNLQKEYTRIEPSEIKTDSEIIEQEPGFTEDVSPLIEKFKKELNISKKQVTDVDNVIEKESSFNTKFNIDKREEPEKKAGEIVSTFNNVDDEKEVDRIEEISDGYSLDKHLLSSETNDKPLNKEKKTLSENTRDIKPVFDVGEDDSVNLSSPTDIRSKLRGLFSLNTDEPSDNTSKKETDFIDSFFQEIEDEKPPEEKSEKEKLVPDLKNEQEILMDGELASLLKDDDDIDIEPEKADTVNVKKVETENNVIDNANDNVNEIADENSSDESEGFDYGYNFPDFEKKSYLHRLKYKLPIILIGLAVFIFVVYKFVDLFDVTYDYEYYLSTPKNLSLTDTLPMVMESSIKKNVVKNDTVGIKATTGEQNVAEKTEEPEKPTDMKNLVNKLDNDSRLVHYSYDISDKLRINVVNKGRAYLKKKREMEAGTVVGKQ